MVLGTREKVPSPSYNSFLLLGGLEGRLHYVVARREQVGEARDDLAARREEDIALVSTLADDDGDDNSGDNSRSGYSSGVNSNDRTGSGHSAVSRDGERSRGDLTRDRTRDGAGGRKRDWSGNRTNDRSRNDTR